MKKLVTGFGFLFVMSSSTAFGQNVVTRQHNGQSFIYGGTKPFLDAYNDAESGDTIYLTGFDYRAGQPTIISKQITIIGTGFFPDSTLATGRTIIGEITFNTGADKSRLEGLYIVGSVNIANNQKVDSLVITRNHITGGITFYGNYSNPCTGSLIYQNLLDYIYCDNSMATRIYNNFICQVNNAKANTHISNNVFKMKNSYYPPITGALNAFIENNIFILAAYSITVYINSYYNTFKKNMFSIDPTSDANQTWIENYIDINISAQFINYGDIFDYTKNFHLVDPSSYLGSDGLTEVGVYGGPFPYKDGALPVNPHIQYKYIAPKTDSNGNLNIEIKVAAQQN